MVLVAVGIVAAAENSQMGAPVLRPVPEKLAAERLLARLTDFTQRWMLEWATALVDGVEGKPAADTIAKRPAHEAFDGPGRIVADPEIQPPLEFLRRLARKEVDRTAGGVAPVERSLRSLEHLDPLDVEQQKVQHGGVAVVDLVDVNGDGRALNGGEVVETDAPQHEVGNGVRGGV